ncbi:YjbF family lipoprotein [Tropicimonas sp. TH_r6]|uniref:YjbF family lipoprotein n=1 Tax=Tropicimonas sp. TH_r6 TaxID=3082085 RepID=UPI002954AF23|nr:YjbF family lipoprotein [Tropicimonas sp. TH_r6]MDV7141368.1 YjbF family lipoprotein [Tropicimonas sp. TH_r6]
MRHTAAALLLIPVMALAGCDGNVGRLERFTGVEQSEEFSIPIPVDGSRPVLMDAGLEKFGSNEALVRVSSRAGVEIWRSESGDTLTLQEGIVLGTRALTPDLLSVEAALPSQWLGAPRPATAPRVHRYVDGEEQVFIRAYSCVLSETSPVELSLGTETLLLNRTDEDCYNATQSFTNSYWMNGSGQMVLSRQWLGPELEHLVLKHYLP